MQDRSKVGRTGGAKERKKWRFECSDAQPDTGPTAWLVAAVLPLPIAAAGDLEPTSNPLFFELAPVRPRGLAGNCPLIGFRSAVCPTKRPAGAVAGDTSSRVGWFPDFLRRSYAAFCFALGRFFLTSTARRIVASFHRLCVSTPHTTASCRCSNPFDLIGLPRNPCFRIPILPSV